ncbi:c-type cytochrome [Comamonas aquatica]|jgi:cytochrome c553|uniref:Cytochrome C n=1 Tax=Comamonas aquatica DA1877 TaxID=1457173 RepID=A0A014P2W7_9BURK|nr:c-type cytochrome [Comamonas aquatica]EXU80495.1 cytochrome C [Comamonas aquatica DA1877]
MHLRFLAPLHVCLKLVLRAACLCAVVATAVQAQPAKSITQDELQARLQEAKAQPELGHKLYTLGRKVAAVCANCHADQNGKAILEVPYLDGQNPAYLVEQIRQFSQGLRKNTFMEGILKAMSRDEMVGMVLFYEKEPLPARPPKDAVLVAQGKAYFERICVNCHGTDGRGNERLPRIAGQHTGYVQMTLTRYREGSRVRSDPNMAFVTKGMSDQDIRAVASYLATMP